MLRSRPWSALALGALAWVAAAAATGPAHAGIGWEKQGGALQVCLDAKAKAWLDAKVELVVNDDPAAGAISDQAVAEWAGEALKECSSKAAGGDAASEQQFMKYMAHWREHIYAAAEEIRRRSRPD